MKHLILFVSTLTFIASCSPPMVKLHETKSKTYVCGNTEKFFINDICSDETEILETVSAKKVIRTFSLPELNQDRLTEISLNVGVDQAVALYYLSILKEADNKDLHKFIERKKKEIQKTGVPKYQQKYKIFYVPGMFYNSPMLQAQKESLHEMVDEFGYDFYFVPIEETGTIETNGSILCDSIQKEKSDLPILLVSTSKGGADVKTAIQICGSKEFFTKVKGWFNIGGIVKGSPMVNLVNESFRKKVEARIMFWYSGFNWQGFQSVSRDKQSTLYKDLELPYEMVVVNIVALPIERYISLRSAPYYQQLLHLGPNDGLALIGDSYIRGSITYGAWGNDHYFWNLREKVYLQSFLSFIVEKIAKRSKT